MWVGYALTAALFTSFLPIISKRLLVHAPVALVAWVPNALSLPILLAATLALRGWPRVDALFFAGLLASGMLNLIATLASTTALQRADASLATPLLSFNPAFTMLISAFVLGEQPDLRGLLGVLTIVAGAYLFQVEHIRAGLFAPLRALAQQPGVLLAIGASFVWGLTPIFEKVAIQHSFPENPLAVAFATTLLTTAFLLPAVLRSRVRLAEQLQWHWPGFLAASLISGLAPLFGFTAIALGYVGYVTALFKLSAVLTVVWAALLLGEQGLRRRFPAAIVMAVGGLLIAT